MSYKNKTILCIITARSGSKGLKNKNILKIKNKPLLAYPVEYAKKSKLIDKILISTDSIKYAKIAKKYGAILNDLRPRKYSSDNSSSIDTVLYEITNDFLKNKIIYDYVILLEPTSPMTNNKIIDDCIKKIINHKIAKSLIGVGVVKSQHPMFLATKKNNLLDTMPYNRKIKFYRRQDLENLYFFDGSIYISEINYLKKVKSFISKKTFLYEMDKINNFEIDDIYDFQILERLL